MKPIFPQLCGNDAAKERIGASIAAGTLPHAFLLSGPEGAGKRTFARLIAAALNCAKKGDDGVPLPCGVCSSCRRILEDGHPDVHLTAPHDGRATIGVADAHLIREDAFLSPTEADYKVYIVDRAETLTPQAQNALLTVTEEPPPGVVILLLCRETDRILTTIKSRAQLLTMERFTREKLAEHLASLSPDAVKLSRETLLDLASEADGVIGKALSLIRDKDGEGSSRAAVRKLVSSLDARVPFAEVRAAVLKLPDKRAELAAALEEATNALRDAIVLRKYENAQMTFFADAEECRAAMGSLPEKRLHRLCDLFTQIGADLAANANIPALLVRLAAQIKTQGNL